MFSRLQAIPRRFSSSVSNDKAHRSLRLTQLAELENAASHTIYTAASAPAATAAAAAHRLDAQADIGKRVELLVRVSSVRRAGKALLFADASDVAHRQRGSVQLKIHKDALPSERRGDEGDGGESFEALSGWLRRGDVLRVRGEVVALRNKAQLSVAVTSGQWAAWCLRPWQTGQVSGRARHVELMDEPRVLERFVARAKAVQCIRRVLEDELGFVETETPVLSERAGGALARPFVTSARRAGLGQLTLRVAPELYLKRLIVGGFDRVYEIGKQFRNEGVDRTHNPEFTTLELYQVDAALQDHMQLTQQLFRTVAERVLGGVVQPVRRDPNDENSVFQVDFSRPFATVSFVEQLNASLGVADCTVLSRAELADCVRQHCAESHDAEQLTHAKLFDRLFEHFVEPQLIEPTFVLDYPLVTSPLARAQRDNERLAERFELFMCQTELANAYGELADPREQAKRFAEQQRDQQLDDEAMPPDADFVAALEYGMPPTVGYGLGIDRMMLLMFSERFDTRSIHDTILFPLKNNE